MSVPYHRLFRVGQRYRWWRPLHALAVFLGLYLTSQLVIGIAYIVPIATTRGQGGTSRFLTAAGDDALSTSDPVVFSMTLVSLVVLLPSMMFAVRFAGLGPFGQLGSVRLRFRWRWAVRCLLPLAVVTVVVAVVQFWGAISFSGGIHWNTGELGQPTVGGGKLVVAIVMVLVGVPFQAAAEEYVFRGYILQTIGSWIRRPVVGRVAAVAVSTVVFALMHLPNGYNVWGILDVGSFGAIAAVIVLRTGGLEATVMQHAMNNIVIFLFQAPGWTRVGSGSDGSPGGFLVSAGASLLYWGLIELVARRAGLVRRRPGGEAVRAASAGGWGAAPPRPVGDAPQVSASSTPAPPHADGVGDDA